MTCMFDANQELCTDSKRTGGVGAGELAAYCLEFTERPYMFLRQ